MWLSQCIRLRDPLATPSLQPHNSTSPPNTSSVICTSQAGSTCTKEPRQQWFPRGGTDDQPPALTSELPTDPQQRPGLQRAFANVSAACASETAFQERAGPYHSCPHGSSSSERLLFSRSSHGVLRPQPCRSLLSTLQLASAVSFSQSEHSVGSASFLIPAAPSSASHLLGRASRAGLGCCGALAEPHGVARCRRYLSCSGSVHLHRFFFFFPNPKVLTLELHVFPGHSYFVCSSISIYGESLPWRSSRSRGNRR